MRTGLKSKLEFDAMHCARSKAIDAFSKVEQALGFLLDLAGLRDNGDTLGTKITRLHNAELTLGYSSERRERVRALLANIPKLVDIRNAIVHSPMKFFQSSGADVEARFTNPKYTVDGSYLVVVLQLEGLEFIAGLANRLAHDLTDPDIIKPVQVTNQTIWELIDANQQEAVALN